MYKNTFMCMYICTMCACMYVCMYVYMLYVYMYHICIYVLCMYVQEYIYMYVCIYVLCVYVYMYYMCMYVKEYISAYIKPRYEEVKHYLRNFIFTVKVLKYFTQNNWI